MSDQESAPKLHIDADWKTEAANEKEQLLEQERQRSAPDATDSAGMGRFAELINMLAMQAAIGLGGYQSPGGESIPPNPDMAKHHIDLLDMLEAKTKGNLTDDENKLLNTVLHELRMQYVQTVAGGAPTGPPRG